MTCNCLNKEDDSPCPAHEEKLPEWLKLALGVPEKRSLDGAKENDVNTAQRVSDKLDQISDTPNCREAFLRDQGFILQFEKFGQVCYQKDDKIDWSWARRVYFFIGSDEVQVTIYHLHKPIYNGEYNEGQIQFDGFCYTLSDFIDLFRLLKL